MTLTAPFQDGACPWNDLALTLLEKSCPRRAREIIKNISLFTWTESRRREYGVKSVTATNAITMSSVERYVLFSQKSMDSVLVWWRFSRGFQTLQNEVHIVVMLSQAGSCRQIETRLLHAVRHIYMAKLRCHGDSVTTTTTTTTTWTSRVSTSMTCQNTWSFDATPWSPRRRLWSAGIKNRALPCASLQSQLQNKTGNNNVRDNI